VPSVF